MTKYPIAAAMKGLFKDCLRNPKFLEEVLGEVFGGEKARALMYALEHGEDLLHDPLTGLYDRRFMEDFWKRETARAQRNRRPLSIALLDIDGLKGINDRYGHQMGDLFLKTLSATIQEVMRTSDLCFRWGGDEFLVILPETNREGAFQFLNRVEDNLLLVGTEVFSQDKKASEISKMGVNPAKVEFSSGVAEWDGTASLEELFNKADINLYECKAGDYKHKQEKGRKIKGGR